MKNSKMRKFQLCIFLMTVIGCFFLCKNTAYAKNIVVMIDPGHGGENLGAQPETGQLEKDMTMTIAEAMYDRLNQYEGIDVFLTRTSDVELSLEERAQEASEVSADFLFSLHLNMSEEHRLYGAEVWIPSNAYYKQCYQFASLEMEELKSMGLYDRGIKTKLKKNNDEYYGLIRNASSYNIPSVIIEHCHMDNEMDAGFYEDDTKLTAFGIRDAEAVAKYFGLKSTLLGTDYSGYQASNVSVPNISTTIDKTGPDVCLLTLDDYDSTTGKIKATLTAKDTDSRVIYYDISMDGGKSYSELYEITEEQIQLSLSVEDGETPDIMVRAYNNYDCFSVSNELLLETAAFPVADLSKNHANVGTAENPMSEDVITIETPTDTKQVLNKIHLFILIVVLLLIMLTTILLANKLAANARRKKARKRHKRR